MDYYQPCVLLTGPPAVLFTDCIVADRRDGSSHLQMYRNNIVPTPTRPVAPKMLGNMCMPNQSGVMANRLPSSSMWVLAVILGLLVANCAKPVPGEKEMLGKIKGKASLRLADGSTISQPGTDEYSPYLVKLSDGYLALVFGSNQGGMHDLYVTKSTTAFDGELLPFFNTPQKITSGIGAGSRISFAAKASGTNVVVYVNYAGISSATIDPTNPGSASLSAITNTAPSGHTIIGISGDGSKIYSTDGSGIGHSFEASGSTVTPFGYGMDNATSATQVRQENSGYDDAILGVYYSSTYAAAGEQYFGPIIDLDTSLAFSGLSITGISTYNADSAANDLVLFSAFDFFDGFTEDLYVITSHTSKDLWDAAGFPGLDFSGGGGGSPLRIFVTNNTYNGGLSGIIGADAKCNDVADANNPNDGSSYKALVAVSGVRDTTTDWPFLPNNPYLRSDMITPIEVTDQFGILPDTLINSITTSPPANSFSGMQTGWTASASSSVANCDAWTNNASGTQYFATPTVTDLTGTSFFTSSIACTSFLTLICVEQPP